MGAMRWTTQQQNAITARGGSLLVSAGAGSGKTAVLTERVVQQLFDPQSPISADRMLIVTYTRAAAQEMKQRIRQKLTVLLEQNPGNLGLRRQLLLLEQAQISTVHAFCQELLRQNFQRLSLAPDFRIADDRELEVWEYEAVSQVMEEFYAGEDPAFLELVELLSAGRDDAMVTRVVRRLYTFVRSHPFYEDWLDEKLLLYRGESGAAQSPWGQVLLDYACQSLEFAAQRIQEGLSLMEGDEKILAAYGDAFYVYGRQVQELLSLAREGRWDPLVKGLAGVEHPSFGRLLKYSDTVKKSRVTACRNDVKEILQQLAQRQFSATEEEFLEDLADLAPKVEQLFLLTKAYGRRLDERKRQQNALDFSDLEHLALRLLVEKTPEGYRPTQYASEISRQFDAVYIDEYQDTNQVQEEIFRAVSQGESNLFMVGDVKQSIYRFRQAMPEIFLEKKQRFAPFDGERFPAQISLAQNFRSRREVTDWVNFLFELLMSREMGEIDYRQGEQLIPGAEYPLSQEAGCELHLLEVDQGEDSQSATHREADYVAARIGEMLRQGYLIQDGDRLRPVRPGDICILMRAPKSKAAIYQDALTRQGIEALAEAQRGYLTSREISSVLSLLQVVDNPLLDVELAGAMMSPLFAFTPDEMGEIRATRPTGPLYLALVARAGQGCGHCQSFLELLEKLRLAAGNLSADQLIIRLYDLTHAEAIFLAGEGGALRRQNLRLLIDHAAACEARGVRGISGFLGFVNRLREQGGDLGESSVVSGGADSVSILSIHKSKGLEFPVVFLVDTAKTFNTVDLRQPFLLHSQLGFACLRRDMKQFRQFTTLPMEAIRLDLERSNLSEELRMLYVALTRAKERLIVTGSWKNPEKKMASLVGGLADGRISPHQVGSCRSYLDWLLSALLWHPDGWELRRLAGWEEEPLAAQGHFRLVLAAPGEQSAEENQQTAFLSSSDPALLEQLRRRGEFRYPWQRAVELPTKMAISAIAHQSAGESYRFRRRPAFLYEKGLTPTERGNALHRFMQFCDYRLAAQDPQGEIDRLVARGFLRQEEGKAIDPARLEAFFHSSLAGRIFSAQQVLREYRFLAEVGGELLAPYTGLDLGEEKTTLQGVADCIIIEDGQAVIVDYKTDRVTSGDQLEEQYGVQLLLYRELVAKSLAMPVKECIIYAFALDAQLEIGKKDLKKHLDRTMGI